LAQAENLLAASFIICTKALLAIARYFSNGEAET